MPSFSVDKELGRVRAYGVVGGDFDEINMMEALDELGGEDVTVQLSSPGGEVFSGISMYNQLRQYPGKVTVEVDAVAASIASIIMLAGDTIRLNNTAKLMIHQAWTVAAGNAKEFRHLAELLEMHDRDLAEVYAERAGGTVDEWFEMMADETWFNASEAVEKKLADEIIDPETDRAVAAEDVTPQVFARAVAIRTNPALTTAARLRRKLGKLDNA